MWPWACLFVFRNSFAVMYINFFGALGGSAITIKSALMLQQHPSSPLRVPLVTILLSSILRYLEQRPNSSYLYPQL